METIGPAAGRDAMGPFLRLAWLRETPRPTPKSKFIRYAAPVALIPLSGLTAAAWDYLADNRTLPTAAVAVIAIGSVLPVVITYRRPLVAWRIAFVMLFVGVANTGPAESWPWNVVQILGFLIVIGRLALTQDSAMTIWATLLTLVPVLALAHRPVGPGFAVLIAAIVIVCNIIWRLRHSRRILADRLAEEEELTELERARRAVLEERTRIAREMHDVVAHHMSMIAVRAETAPYRIGDLPEPAKDELAGIAAAAREALTEMRRLLGVLRAEDGEVLKTPQPGLADIESLVATAVSAGVEVTMTLDEGADLGEGTALGAYRIVQEALANAARHAPGGPVTIGGRVVPGFFDLTVRNALTRDKQAAPDTGHGLVGMRERATLLGGDLTARPVGQDFVVHARLPLPGPLPAGTTGTATAGTATAGTGERTAGTGTGERSAGTGERTAGTDERTAGTDERTAGTGTGTGTGERTAGQRDTGQRA